VYNRWAKISNFSLTERPLACPGPDASVGLQLYISTILSSLVKFLSIGFNSAMVSSGLKVALSSYLFAALKLLVSIQLIVVLKAVNPC
jgi:hypothetical protein